MNNRAFFFLLDAFFVFLIVCVLLASVMHKTTTYSFEKTVLMQKISDAVKVTHLQLLSKSTPFFTGTLCNNLRIMLPKYKVVVIWGNKKEVCGNAVTHGKMKMDVKSYFYHLSAPQEIEIVIEK